MFGPQPTEEEWKVWCNKNKQLWDSEYWCINNVSYFVDTSNKNTEKGGK